MKWLMMSILGVTLVAAGPARADSLYSQYQYRPLVADHRAYRLGDNLTVLITEIASVSTTANTSIGKNESISANLITRKNSADVGVGLSNDFDGNGKIERTGRLLAHLTASVLSVEPNGDLWIKGEQEIEVNNERQRLSLEGRVRVQDIAADNTVSSTRVSDARIKYTGSGLLALNQTPSIFTRILRWLRIL